MDDLKRKIVMMRARGDSIPEIATALGMRQSQVNQAVIKFGIERIDMSKMSAAKKQKSLDASTVRYSSASAPVNSENKLDKAKRILGGRLVERNGGFLLDGKPAKVWDLLREAGISVK